MNLKCYQTDAELRAGEEFFVAGRFNDGNTVTISKAAIDHIPASDRRPQSCEDIDDYLGVDIYVGRAVPRGDFYDATSMTTGEFAVFSVSREAMHRYLGELVGAFPERFPPKKKLAM